MALLYSARFRRCTGARPGFGLAAAALSSVFSRKAAKAAAASGVGRVRTVGGGISPERTFNRTFSQISPCAGTSARLRPWRDNPPVLVLLLWQATQLFSTRPPCVSAGD